MGWLGWAAAVLEDATTTLVPCSLEETATTLVPCNDSTPHGSKILAVGVWGAWAGWLGLGWLKVVANPDMAASGRVPCKTFVLAATTARVSCQED